MSNPEPKSIDPDRFAHSSLLDAMPDAVVIVDNRGIIVQFNVRAAGMFGYAREEVLGQPVEFLIPERFHDRHAGDRSTYARSPHVRPMGAGLSLVARHKSGSEFPVEVSLSPYQSPEGPLVVSAIRPVPAGRTS